ncbi:MAG: endo-1,4-beta-xylanase [Balneola sp.]|nr:endo-1,4-beta-xylanase [Balneola sp.]|tara:strand:- start:53074 stop:53973 length:900 start_codon:yes stop_codon:yes gene_type:complete
MKKTSLFILLLFCSTVNAQEVIDLYPDGVPNAKVTGTDQSPHNGLVRQVLNPTLEVYRPSGEDVSKAAVIVVPGGGYSVLVYNGEGVNTAKEFARNGVTAFVLKYRLPHDTLQTNKTIAPLQDAQQAIKTVRENAEKWNISPDEIGIMGFSAGGHLASTAATHFKESVIQNENSTSLRPDFQILVYPVISMQDSLTHADSKRKLLGESPSKEMVDKYSNELQITENTPLAYITHAGDDDLVVVENSLRYYKQLLKHQVPAELHLYPEGGHGFIFRQPIDEWMHPLFRWLSNSGFINVSE